MGRGSNDNRALRSARATQQFFSQGLPDGSAPSSGEGHSPSTHNTPSSSSPAPLHTTRPQSENPTCKAISEAKPLPGEYDSLAPPLSPEDKLEFIRRHLWQRAEKTLIAQFKTHRLQAIQELAVRFAFAYSNLVPGRKTRSWHVDPEIIRRIAEGIVTKKFLHPFFQTNAAEPTCLRAGDIVITANPGLSDWEVAAFFSRTLLNWAVKYEDSSDDKQASPTTIIGLIDLTYCSKVTANRGDIAPKDKFYWDWFRLGESTRMESKENLIVPDAAEFLDQFEDCYTHPTQGDVTKDDMNESHFQEYYASIMQSQSSSSTLRPAVPRTSHDFTPTTTTTTTTTPPTTTQATTSASAKGKGKAVEKFTAEAKVASKVTNPVGDDDADVLAPPPTTPTTTSTGDKKKKKRKNRKKKNKSKNKKKSDKGKGKEIATDLDGEESLNDHHNANVHTPDDGSMAYYSANNCDEYDNDEDGDDEDDYYDEDDEHDDEDNGEEKSIEELNKKLPSLYDQIMSSYAAYSEAEATKATVEAALKAHALEKAAAGGTTTAVVTVAGKSSSAGSGSGSGQVGPTLPPRPSRRAEGIDAGLDRSRSVSKKAANENLQRHLLAVLERVKGKRPEERRAILAREHQRILRSETLAAARGTQALRPTATRATMAAAAGEGLQLPRFNLGVTPGWLGELERMQMEGLRGGGGGRGGDEKKEEK
ncbi:hypothetical protein RBB50_010965 [Rhinocladiella similis]